MPNDTSVFILETINMRPKKYEKMQMFLNTNFLELLINAYIKYKLLNKTIISLNSITIGRKFDLIVGKERTTAFKYVQNCIESNDNQLIQLSPIYREMFLNECNRDGYLKESFASTYLTALFLLKAREKLKQNLDIKHESHI
jgi:hypothetical protein